MDVRRQGSYLLGFVVGVNGIAFVSHVGKSREGRTVSGSFAVVSGSR